MTGSIGRNRGGSTAADHGNEWGIKWKNHKKRLIESDNTKILNYKADYAVDNYTSIIQKIVSQSNIKRIPSKISMNGKDCIITW